MANGKIKCLPAEIREQLNQRLYLGEPGKSLVAWLNSLPEVQAIITSEFGGKPVWEQNLSQWRKWGYREWLVQHETTEAMKHVCADAAVLRDQPAGELSDNVALRLTARYLLAAEKMKARDGGLDWMMMRDFCSDLVALRRGDHSEARLSLQRERLNIEASRR